MASQKYSTVPGHTVRQPNLHRRADPEKLGDAGSHFSKWSGYQHEKMGKMTFDRGEFPLQTAEEITFRINIQKIDFSHFFLSTAVITEF